MPTITDTTPSPQFVPSGSSSTLFGTISTTDVIGNTEEIRVVLVPSGSASLNDSNLGTLGDASGGGAFNATTDFFTEAGAVTGTPDFGTSLFQRLNYVAPTLAPGQSAEVAAYVLGNDNGGVFTLDPHSPTIIDVVTAPGISGTVTNEPVASTGTIRPFSTVKIMDEDFNLTANDTATITITDPAGTPTDADGLLTGSGLSKTGVGTYALTNPDLPGNIQSELNSLVFTPTAITTAGATKTPSFELDVTDTKAKLTSKDTTTSVLISGPPAVPVAPTIAGTVAGQTVTPGSVIDPFSGVTISDANTAPAPTDSITITVMNGTTPTDGNGTLTGAGLTETSPGVYTIAAATPATVTTELDNLTFHPTGAPPVTTNFKLAVTDPGVAMTATDTTTSVIEQNPMPPPPHMGGSPPPMGGTPPPSGSGDYQISDETNGTMTTSNGQPYTGPVAGIVNDIIMATSDNINILPTIPNVFIHTGSGNDAIDVSGVNGNNILDGSTGTNFLTGGTGSDTFFVDDRNLTSDVFDTINGFHSGDSATVWGVTPSDFTITPGNNVLASAPGLDFAITAPGKPNANINLPNFSTTDLGDGKLTMSFGTSPSLPGLPGSPYMLIQAT